MPKINCKTLFVIHRSQIIGINLIRTVIPSQKILTVSGRFQETQIVCHTLANILGRDILEDDQIQIAPEIAAQRYREEVAQVDKAFVLRPQG